MKIAILLISLISFGLIQSQDLTTITKSIQEHDQIKFDSIAKSLNYKGGDQIKVSVLFTINENGDIVDVKARSVHPLFENEAIRIVNSLPKMKPTEKSNERISRKYALPLVFVIETDREKAKRLRREKNKELKTKVN